MKVRFPRVAALASLTALLAGAGAWAGCLEEPPLPGARLYPGTSIDVPYQIAIDGLEIAKLVRAKNGIAQLCRDTSLHQAREDFTEQFDGTSIKVKSDEDLKKFLSRRRGEEFAWPAGHFPDLAIRKGGFENAIVPNLGFASVDQLKLFLQGDASQRSPVSLNGTDDFPVQGSSDFDDQIKGLSSPLRFQVACNMLVLGYRCGKALEDAVRMAAPVNHDDVEIAFPSLYQEVLGDRRYDAGLAKATLKMLKEVESGNLEDADLFTDIESSFEESGIKKSEANEMTFSVLGLIATGGPNFLLRVKGLKWAPEQISSVVALSSIASLTPILDSIAAKANRRFYSYPKNVHTTCETGKPYHFWETAYLARKLTQKGYSVADAAAAAFTAQKGYEMFSTTDGRVLWRPFAEDYLSPYATSIRMDLAFSSAAAVYGAKSIGSSASQPVLDVDHGLGKILRESRAPLLGNMSRHQAESLAQKHPLEYSLYWTWKFAPDAAFPDYWKAK